MSFKLLFIIASLAAFSLQAAAQVTVIETNDGGRTTITTTPEQHIIDRVSPSGNSHIESIGRSGWTHQQVVSGENFGGGAGSSKICGIANDLLCARTESIQ